MPRWRLDWSQHFISIILPTICIASFCGDNKIPFGIEIYKNGHPMLLCSKPSCYDKTFAVSFLFGVNMC